MINDRLITLKIRILSTGSVFICGLATAIGHITSCVSRKPCRCSLRPHHAVSSPHRKTSLSGPFPCSSVPKFQRTCAERQSANSLRRPVRDGLVFIGEGQQPNANPSVKPLFQNYNNDTIKVFYIPILRTLTR